MRFTTNAYPKEQRREAWRFALQRVALDLTASADTPYGELVQFRGELGIEFLVVAGTPQSLMLDFSGQADLFWLVMLLDGTALLCSSAARIEAEDGDIVYGLGDVPASLEFPTDARLLLVKIPRALLTLRLRTPLPEQVGKLASEGGATRMFSGMLRAVAETIPEVTADQMRPVEFGLPEFLVASLLDNAPPRALGGAAGMRAALLERIFQTIEMRLGDPGLSLRRVASEHGVSPRYLQKLFESVGDSFGHYIKVRRLERCRLDLRSPLHAQKSISGILFEWGFNDSASFSRAFRVQYGISPREYRKAAPGEARAGLPRRARPTARREQRAETTADELSDTVRDVLPPKQGLLPPGVRPHLLPVSPETTHGGCFGRELQPVLEVCSGDYVTVETLTHHAADDAERMVEGDAGAESVCRPTTDEKAAAQRGAAPIHAPMLRRGPGESFGTPICTGPIAIQGAKPGDIVEVRVIDISPRPSGNPKFAGRTFGSNATAYRGLQHDDLPPEPRRHELITIYEVERRAGRPCAHAVYHYRRTPQTDPSGAAHSPIDHPGVPVDPAAGERKPDMLGNVEIPIRPHFGVIGLAPAHAGLVGSVPPAAFGHLDNWRTGPGSRIFLPVQVAGGLLSLGDPHASSADSEACGTAIRCSMTAVVQIVLHPAEAARDHLRGLDHPLIETDDEWLVLGFGQSDYRRGPGDAAQGEAYRRPLLDAAMRDAFRKALRFLMAAKQLSEDEAISFLSVGVDFGVTQAVNGNWTVRAVIRKAMFPS